MRLGLLVRELGGSCELPPDGGPWIRDVQLDSRRVGTGDLFAALPGRTADGARFIGEALGRGAAAVLTPVELALPGAGGPAPAASGARVGTPAVWRHADARRVLGQAAAIVHGRPSAGLHVVAITGTNGKTTTAHLVAQLLERAGRRPAVLGTAGHRLAGGEALVASHTTPDAAELQRILARHRAGGGDAVVMEVSSHGLVQERTSGLEVAVAAFTNLSRDHLDYHGDMETYAAAKERLFAGLGAGAVAVVNADDPASARMARAARARGARVVAFGMGPGADLMASDVSVDLRGTHLLLEGMGISRTWVRTPLVGRFNARNALAALACVLLSGASPADAVGGLASVSPAPGRLERVSPADHPFAVYVDYAHTEEALRNVLETLRECLGPGGRLLCVFGCGGDRDPGKRGPMGRVVGELVDLAFATSDNPRGEDPERILAQVLEGLSQGRARVCQDVDRRAAIARAIEAARPGDLVLLAGRGHETHQIVGGERIELDDRRVAEELLS